MLMIFLMLRCTPILIALAALCHVFGGLPHLNIHHHLMITTTVKWAGPYPRGGTSAASFPTHLR
jgi:hypothetical protein